MVSTYQQVMTPYIRAPVAHCLNEPISSRLYATNLTWHAAMGLLKNAMALEL